MVHDQSARWVEVDNGAFVSVDNVFAAEKRDEEDVTLYLTHKYPPTNADAQVRLTGERARAALEALGLAAKKPPTLR